MTHGTKFAIAHGIACLRELARYARAGVVVEELLADVAIVLEVAPARALGGGDA